MPYSVEPSFHTKLSGSGERKRVGVPIAQWSRQQGGKRYSTSNWGEPGLEMPGRAALIPGEGFSYSLRTQAG